MADHLTGLSSMATRRILAALADMYKKRTGCAVAITSMGGVDAVRLVRNGTNVDVIILASQVMAQLESEGFVVAGSRKDFARSDIAIAVRAGAPRPAIDDERSVRQAMLDARRICYSTGPSGDHLKRLWQRWGIADAMAQRAIQAPPGVPVGEMLARGNADLGFQQFSELLDSPGVEIVGPLPPAIQATTIFAAGIGRSSSQIETAQGLLAFLISPETVMTKQRYGMNAPQG